MSRVWQSVATDADRSRLEAAVNAALEALGREGALDPTVNREILSGAAVREALGLGALEALLGDPAVQEIIVERPDRIVIDTGDGIELAHVVFSSEQAVRVAAARLLAQVSIALDTSRPVQHARISEAWAVTIIHNAGSPQPILALERLERRAPTFDSLVKDGLIPAAAATTLREAVQGRRTILVSGPEGSGVTTLITALLDITDSRERVGAITNPPGLVTDRDTVISLVRESGAATASLVREMARLRVARIAVDDVAGAEAYDVLVAVATRYPGALLGIHARSSRDALRLLETFTQLDARCTNPAAASALLGESVQLVVQVSTGSDGRPRVTQVNDVQRTASGVSLTG